MKRVSLLCTLALLLSTSRQPARAQDALNIEFEKFELSNGLDVILHEDHSVPIVAVNLWYHVGSANETPGRTGLAHLFEHMMFQGSKHQNDEFDGPLERIGADSRGYTTNDHTGYGEIVPSNYLELALWLESDRMGFLLPALTQEKLDNQRDVVKNERRQYFENQPYGKVWDLWPSLMYPKGHPYSWPVIGSMEDLSAASLDDVRDFFRRYYTPNNASLVIAGDFNRDSALSLARKYFGTLPAGPDVDRLVAWQPELNAPKRLVAVDNVKLPRLYWFWHTPAQFAPGDAEAELLRQILTKGKNSRLYTSLVVEQDVALEVSSSQMPSKLGSVFRIEATARQGRELVELEEALSNELRKLLTDGVTEEELQTARAYTEAGFVHQLENIFRVADQLNRYNVHLGDPGAFSWDLRRFSSATVDDVMDYARRYLDPSKRGTIWVLPRAEMAQTEADVDRSVVPEPGPEPRFEPPKIHWGELANGLRILVVEDHSVPLVQAAMVLKGGLANDPWDRQGTAALTSELLDEGTTTRSAQEIAAEVTGLAAYMDATSTFDGSVVAMNVLKKNLREGLTLLADVVKNPTFPTTELERYRNIYLDRIAENKKEPRRLNWNTFLRELYGENHPYGQPQDHPYGPSIGTGAEEAIREMTREDLLEYYEANYTPGNAAFLLVGDVTPAEAKTMASSLFGDWRSGSVKLADLPSPEPITETKILIVDKPGAAQSVIRVGNLGVTRSSPDYYAFQVFREVLGEGFMSRLNLNLREDKGYTYGVRLYFWGLRTPGPYGVATSVQADKTAEALAEILGEFRDVIGARPITEKEVTDATGRLIKGFAQRFQTVRQILHGQLDDIVTYDLSDGEWSRFIDRMSTMTAEEVNRVARKYVDPEALLIVIVGDCEKIQPVIEALDVGEVQRLSAEPLRLNVVQIAQFYG